MVSKIPFLFAIKWRMIFLWLLPPMEARPQRCLTEGVRVTIEDERPLRSQRSLSRNDTISSTEKQNNHLLMFRTTFEAIRRNRH